MRAQCHNIDLGPDGRAAVTGKESIFIFPYSVHFSVINSFGILSHKKGASHLAHSNIIWTKLISRILGLWST